MAVILCLCLRLIVHVLAILGLIKLNPAAKTWDGPMELRCANDSSGNLSGWGPSEYMFPVYYYRALPYDPPRPWQDFDGKWYLAVSTDGCNSTTRSKPCKAGGRLDLWTSPRLRGAGASWRQIGPMVTTNANPLDNTGYNEFVTTDFFGAVPGKCCHIEMTENDWSHRMPANALSRIWCSR